MKEINRTKLALHRWNYGKKILPKLLNIKIKFSIMLITVYQMTFVKLFNLAVLSCGIVPVYDCIYTSQKWVLLVNVFTYCIVLQTMCSKTVPEEMWFQLSEIFFLVCCFWWNFKTSNDTEFNTEFICLTFFLHSGLRSCIWIFILALLCDFGH